MIQSSIFREVDEHWIEFNPEGKGYYRIFKDDKALQFILRNEYMSSSTLGRWVLNINGIEVGIRYNSEIPGKIAIRKEFFMVAHELGWLW